MKYNPVTGKTEVKKTNASYPKCLGFFQTKKELSKLDSNVNDYAICFETQTTHKFDGKNWIDEGYLYMPAGKPGKDGETPVGITMVELINGNLYVSFSDGRKENLGLVKGKDAQTISAADIASELLNNEEFIRKTKGKDGVARDGVAPTVQDVVKNLLSNQEFLSKAKGKDGENGKTPTIDSDYIVNLLKQDDGFLSKIKGEPGKPGKDAVVDIKSLAFDLKNDKEFIELTKGKDGIGKDGKSVSLIEIVEGLKEDQDFLDMVKGKDGKDSKVTVEDIAKELKKDGKFQELIKGKDGVGYPGNPGRDGESITVGFSPDGVKDITAEHKEGDKFMYVRVGLRKPTVFQIIK